MEAPGTAWVALVLGGILLGGGLALLAHPAVPAPEPPLACDTHLSLCTQQHDSQEALSAGTGSLLAWAAIGMAAVMDVLFLGLTRGGTVLA